MNLLYTRNEVRSLPVIIVHCGGESVHKYMRLPHAVIYIYAIKQHIFFYFKLHIYMVSVF